MSETGIQEKYKQEKYKNVLAKLFSLTNKLQMTGDHLLGGVMTIRQWLLTLAIAQTGSAPPTIGEVAELLGCSHQNVKQLALNLENKGFLTLEKDREDLRATSLMLTEKYCTFCEKGQLKTGQFLAGLFEELDEEEISSLYSCLNKLYTCIINKKGCSE